jgi:hypothetical protein
LLFNDLFFFSSAFYFLAKKTHLKNLKKKLTQNLGSQSAPAKEHQNITNLKKTAQLLWSTKKVFASGKFPWKFLFFEKKILLASKKFIPNFQNF